MNGTLKALGLALLAVFALSAVAAPAASAANDLFTSNSSNGKTDLTAASTNPTFELTPGGAILGCAKGTYAGTVVGNAVAEVTVHPIFDGPCDAATFPATVDTQGCDFILTGRTDLVGGETHATFEIECTAGKEVKWTLYFDEAHTEELATIHIGAMGPLHGVTYNDRNTAENGSGTETVTVTATVKGIHTTCTSPFCFLLEDQGESPNAIFRDDITVTGYEDSGTFHQNSTTHEWSGTHGPQVHISVSAAA